MNRQQAQFIKDQFLKRFGDKYKVVNQNDLPIIQQVLNQAGLDFNKSITENLEADGSVSTGRLQDVAVPIVTQDGDGYILQVGYPIGSAQLKYYDFINQGVKGVGGKNARPKDNSGKYSFKSKFPNRKMAASIFSWLNKARKSVRTDKIDLSATQRKRRNLAAVVNEAANKKKLAYAISSAIKRDGIKATYYFDKAIKDNFGKDFKEALSIALGGDIIIQLRQYGNNNNSSTANR